MFFETGRTKGIDATQADRIQRILDRLSVATAIKELNIPTFFLHELKGKRKGTWAITVVKNWRITFRFENGEAYDVDLEDYH